MNEIAKRDFFLLIVCASILATSAVHGVNENSERIKSVYFSSQVENGRYTIQLEHPKLYLGSGFVSEDDDGRELFSFSFDGLHVMVLGNRVYVNSKVYVSEIMPKNIWVSDDATEIRINGKEQIFKDLLKTDPVINEECFDRVKLENGYTVERRGGIFPGGSGKSLDDNHYILNMNGMSIRVWGDDLYVWGRHLGKMSDLGGKDMIIRLDLFDLIERFKDNPLQAVE